MTPFSPFLLLKLTRYGIRANSSELQGVSEPSGHPKRFRVPKSWVGVGAHEFLGDGGAAGATTVVREAVGWQDLVSLR